MNVVKLKTDLRNLGIKENDTIVVHSSYKALCGNEKIDGGPHAVIEVLKDTVKTGTLMLPTLSYKSVNSEYTVFDVINTPSCVGVLSDVMRKSEGIFRSIHPTHSIAVWGKDAKEITSAHIRDFTPVGPNSPLHELKRRNGKIVMLGCGLLPNTSMHGIEEMVVTEYLYGSNIEYYLVLHDGTNIKKSYLAHGFNGFDQRYDRVLDVLDKSEYAFGKALNADCYVLDANAVWENVLTKLRENPLYFVDKT